MTAFRVPRGRRVPYLGAAPGLVPSVPLNFTEENEELRCLCGLLSESRAIKLPFLPLPPLGARFWPPGMLAPPVGPSNPTSSGTIAQRAKHFGLPGLPGDAPAILIFSGKRKR